MRCGGVLLDVSGRTVLINPTAMRLLRDGLDPHSNPDWARTALKRLLGKAGSRFRLENENWVVVSRDHRRPLAIHAVPIQGDALSGIHTAVVLVDLEEAPEPNPSVLQKIFGLTAA